MDWLTLVVTAVGVALSTVTILLVRRLDSRSIDQRWLREARLKAVVALKAEVSKVRDRFSPTTPVAETVDQFREGFAAINTAMTELEILSEADVQEEVRRLRQSLREFVRARDGDQLAWKAARLAVDEIVERIIELTRQAIL
jgi:hypothetical protein